MDVEQLNETDEGFNAKLPAKEVIEIPDESETPDDNDDDTQNHASSETITEAQSDVLTAEVQDSKAQLELAQAETEEAQVQVQLAKSKLVQAQATVEVAVAKQGEAKALVRLAEAKAAAAKARVKETQQNFEKLMTEQKQSPVSPQERLTEFPRRASLPLPNDEGHDNLHPLHAQVLARTEQLEQQVLDQMRSELRTLRHMSPTQLAQAQSPRLVNILSELIPPHLLAQAHFHANAAKATGMQQLQPQATNIVTVQGQMQQYMEQLQQIFQRRQQIMQQQQQLQQNLQLQHPFQRMGNNNSNVVGIGISAAIATELATWKGRQAQLRAMGQPPQQQQQQPMAQSKPPATADNGATLEENSNGNSSPPPTPAKRMVIYEGPPQEDLSEYGGWPPGWTKVIYLRKDGKTQDRYWYGPNGIKYDSFVKVRRVFDQNRNASASTTRPAIVPSIASEPETPQPAAQSEEATATDTTDPPTCLPQQEQGTTEQADVQPIATEPVLPSESPKTIEPCHQPAHEDEKANQARVDGPQNNADTLHDDNQEIDYTYLIDKLRDSLLRSFLRGQPEVAISEVLKATGYQTVSGGLKHAIAYLIDHGLLEQPSSECIKMTDGGLKSAAKLKGFSDKEVESMLKRANEAANFDPFDIVTPLCSDEKKRAAQQDHYDSQENMDLEARLSQHSPSKRFKSQEQTAIVTAEKRRDESVQRSDNMAPPNSGMERMEGSESFQDEATTAARNDKSNGREMEEKTPISNKDLAVLIAKIQVFLHRMHEKGNNKLNESQIMEGIGHRDGFWGGLSQALKALENKGHISIQGNTVELTQEGMQTISAVFCTERRRLNGQSAIPTKMLPAVTIETQIPPETASLNYLNQSDDPPTQPREKASNLPRSSNTDIDDYTSDDSDTEMARMINQKMSQRWNNEAKSKEAKSAVSNLEKQHQVRAKFLNFCQSLAILEQPTKPVINGIFDLLSDGECHSKREIFNASGYTYAEMFQFHKTIQLLEEQNVIQHTGQKCYQMSDRLFPCGRFNTATTMSRSCDKDGVEIVSECI